MSGFTVGTDQGHLIRDKLYSKQIRELLLDDLYAMKFVKTLTEFPDGNTFQIPSLGEASTANYDEGQAIKYSKMDTGAFTFSFDTYKYSANSISEKFKQDSFWAGDVQATFPTRQHRALMEAVEVDILSKGPNGQTASSLNTINTADHRWVGSGTGESLTIQDFRKARYALRKANVPATNLCAILDPSAIYSLETQTNVVNLMTPNQMWQSVISENAVTGFRFRYNIYGFDVYESNYLPNSISETIDGLTVSTGVANQFFSAAPGDTLPIIGGFRQMPTVYSEFNKDLQQEEFLTIARWGFKLYRPENMVVILTDTDVV